MRYFPILFVVILAINGIMIVGCCGLPKPFESPTNYYRTQQYTSPLKTPLSLVFLPTPSLPTIATVGGRLVRTHNGIIEPIAETNIMLAPVIYSADGTPVLAAVDKETALMATTDKNGAFVFVDIPPGTYGIVIITPVGLFLLQEKNGNDFLFEVRGGTVLDLGEIQTRLPY